MARPLLTLLACAALAASAASAAPTEPAAPTAPIAPATPETASPAPPATEAAATDAGDPRLDGADDAVPTAVPTAEPASAPAEAPAPAVTAAPAALSAPAAAAAPAAVSAEAQAAEPALPEDIEDAQAVAGQAKVLDLKALGTDVLARLSRALSNDQDAVWYDSEGGSLADEDADGAWRVDAEALYAELARRLARDEDKDARAALGLAILRKDARAQDAKALAFEDKLADSVITQLEGGDAKAKAELQALADKGNRRARQYLGLDKPPVDPTAPAAAEAPLSPSAQAPAAPAPAAEKDGAASPAAASPTAGR